MAMKVQPKIVSTRVVKTVSTGGAASCRCPPAAGAAPPAQARGSRCCVPSLRPIQLRCIVRTASFQPGSWSSPSSSDSRVVRGAHQPLRQLLLAHGLVAAPAAALLHLVVGQHAVLLAPVDLHLLAVDQAQLEELGEQPLRPAVVLRLAGDDLALPVEAEAVALELAAAVADAGRDPVCGAGCCGRSPPARRAGRSCRSPSGACTL